MPRPSQRAAIIDAALHCFADRGFDATRVKHIAEEAGVAESALYRHFPSKRRLPRSFTRSSSDAMQNGCKALPDPLRSPSPRCALSFG